LELTSFDAVPAAAPTAAVAPVAEAERIAIANRLKRKMTDRRTIVARMPSPGDVRLLVLTSGVLLCGAISLGAQAPAPKPPDAAELALRAVVAAAPRLPLEATPLAVTSPTADFAMGMVSWVASSRDGTVYLLQRGDKADPVIAVDRNGTVLRSWGTGLYVMPHAIRVDPQGNVWTADAASSHVIKFSPEGKVLLDIPVGGQPTPCANNFCGTTDIAFAANGHVFISDGYANARVLEYTAEGEKVREWGTPGTGPGQFMLPHSIQIDAAGVVYVADRENGRIQRFDQTGKFLGEWRYGRTFGLEADGAFMWLATQPVQQANLSPGWLLKIDAKTGAIAGWVPSTGNHGMDVTTSGELLVGPGPTRVPQRFRRAP
jgi:sugar lactone lactonase YvrE